MKIKLTFPRWRECLGQLLGFPDDDVLTVPANGHSALSTRGFLVERLEPVLDYLLSAVICTPQVLDYIELGSCNKQ